MSAAARVWRAGSKQMSLDRPIVVGIVNVTPDSFSDGGLAVSRPDAVAHALRLAADGADALDIGGESTRPGAQPVPVEEEQRRVVPVVDSIRERLPEIVISVDTVKSAVAEAALEVGADVVNDVSAGRLDSTMLELCARTGCGVILMHSRGTVADMASYDQASYGPDVTGEVCAELAARARLAEAAGVAHEAIVLDPGFGFSKRTEHSRAILRELGRIVALGYPVMVGLSRKRMIGELTGVTAPAERDAGTIGANVVALTRGARVFRVHDVRAARQALDVAAATAFDGA